VLCLSTSTVLERRIRPPEGPLATLTLQATTAAIAFTAAAAFGGHLAPPPDPTFWVAVAWVIVLSTFGGYGSYLLVLRRSGATRVSTLLYLTPPTTMVWSWFMFGDVPGPLTVPGVALCAVGVWLVLRAPRRDRTGAARPDRSALLRAPSG
jgi:drug/metabolite transporter (DMT)-like permease